MSSEVAFLFVSDCSVTLTSSAVPLGGWRSVRIHRADGDGKACSSRCRQHDRRQVSESLCSHCNLVLNASPDSVELAQGPRFEGTLSDMASPCRSDKQRSDSALLVGAALLAEELRHVAVTNIQILLRRREAHEQTTHIWRAALLVTLAIPLTSSPLTSPLASAAASASGRRRSKTPASSLLPPCVQLLYTMMRSDWNNLQQEQNKLLAHYFSHTFNQPTTHKNTLFPSVLSLEEVYTRIHGVVSSSSLRGSNTPTAVSTLASTTTTTLLNLPADILQANLSPFLYAVTLDSLRNTCAYMHSTLRTIVPGMKLRLFRHQVTSLEWMRKREVRTWSEEEALLQPDDLHRAVSGGATVLVQQRPTHNRDKSNDNHGKWRLDTCTGQILESYPTSIEKCKEASLVVAGTRKVARGGLLCDDPGLGKTITVLSLILQTFGQSTITNGSTVSKLDNDAIFTSYWKEEMTPVTRRPALLKLINSLRCCDPDSYYFEWPVSSCLGEGCEDYYNVVKNPICMKDILKRIDLDLYANDFQCLWDDVTLCFSNAMLYNDPESTVYKAADRLSRRFKAMADEFKANQVESAEKVFSSSYANQESPITAKLAVRAKEELINSLHPSSATLLAVPSTLLNHWENQIMTYVDFSYCTKKIPLIYRHSSKQTKSVLWSGVVVSDSFDHAEYLCKERETHFPLLFIDEKSTLNLPPPPFLAMFRIVLISTQRLTTEWKNGSVEEEIRWSKKEKRLKRDANEAPCANFRYCFAGSDDNCGFPSPSPLLKVHWLRLIVDEGHSMGKGSHNNSIQFASWIMAQRRWIMSGTPTPQTASHSGLRNLLGMVHFLQHDIYSPKFGGDIKWDQYISRSWNEGLIAPFFRLKSLLTLFMVRHTKDDMEELSLPKFTCTFTDMSTSEALAYNTLVSAVHSNIIATSMQGKTSGLQDSLLHSRQSKHAQQALSNLRLACSGGTSVVPTLKEKHWEDTLTYLRVFHKVDKIKVTVVENFLHRVTTEQLSSCMVCGLQLQTLLLLPCADLVCTECITNISTSCPVCEEEFDGDDFQRLQPGLSFEWKWNLIESQKRRESTTRLRQELSDARRNSIRGLGLNNREEEIRPFAALPEAPAALPIADVPNRPWSSRQRKVPHTCMFPSFYTDGKCQICHEQHRECNLVNTNSQCDVCHNQAENCPEEESKAFYVTNRLLKLRSLEQHHSIGDPKRVSDSASQVLDGQFFKKEKRALKAIVFSQFRQVLNLVGDRLLRKMGDGCVAEYWGPTRGKELEKFTKSPECFCMLLGRNGSHGLDLSFVTHIFFLDEIWDKSLESQVVARAYRMGAKGHVDVEQLVARDTVEEMMLNMNKRDVIVSKNSKRSHDELRYAITDSSPNAEKKEPHTRNGEEKEEQQAKLYYLLKNVKLIRRGIVQNTRPLLSTGKTGVSWKEGNEKTGVSRKEGNEKTGHCVRFQL